MGKLKTSKSGQQGRAIYLSQRRRSRKLAQKWSSSIAKFEKCTSINSASSCLSIENSLQFGDEGVPDSIENKSSTVPTTSQTVEDSGFTETISDSSTQDQISTEISFEGRRLVDIKYFLKQIAEISKHPPFDCTFSDMYPINEYRKGLKSNITFYCRMCNMNRTVSLIEDSTEDIDINNALALATVSTGTGYSTADEIFSVLNIPFMSPATYQQKHEQISTVIEKTVWQVMEEAALEEGRLARQAGQVGEDGIPLIAVVTDGAWSKRSYSVNYNASSGVACIIGATTRKILFLGIRNKYCSICARSEANKMSPIPQHKCYKNWTETSTSMETDIIVEGFKRSIEMYNLKFYKLIGDGDSSVSRKLLEARPYGNLLVEKIECRNHLLRNFSKKIRDICGRKRSNSKNLPVSTSLRKLVEDSARRLRTSIKSATMFRIQENNTFAERVKNLCKDLRNVLSHVFGEHKECKEIAYFKCSPPDKEINFIPNMRECGLLEDIEVCMNRLISNANSLIINMDTNIAEQYNSIICKFVGGKRINFSLRGSYESRCKAAAIAFNTGGDYYTVIEDQRLPTFTRKYVQKNKIKRLNQKKYTEKQKNSFRRKSKKAPALPDADYGPDAIPEPDLTDDQFEKKKDEFLILLKKNLEEIKELEVKTRGQAGNPLWQQERMIRLTASNFGEICKMRKTTSCANKIKNLLYSTFGGSESTKYGTEHEPFAIRQFENEFKVKVQDCGIFIDCEDSMFAASPDGLVGEECLIEIKCPKTSSKMHPLEAIQTKIIKFAIIDENNEMQLKNNHNYYFQIQGQLHITKRSLCYFIVWSSLGMLVQKIYRDDSFWEEEMKPKLIDFYMNCLLPELIDPRYPRKLDIRNPPRKF